MGASKLLPHRLRVAANTLRQDLTNLRRAVTGRRRPSFTAQASRPATPTKNSPQQPPRRRPPEQEVELHAPTVPNDAPLVEECVAVFSESGVEVVVAPGQTILEAGLAAGVDLIFSCGLGGCGACMLTCLEGEVDYDDFEAICLLEQDIEQRLCLACVGRPRGRVVLEA